MYVVIMLEVTVIVTRRGEKKAESERERESK